MAKRRAAKRPAAAAAPPPAAAPTAPTAPTAPPTAPIASGDARLAWEMRYVNKVAADPNSGLPNYMLALIDVVQTVHAGKLSVEDALPRLGVVQAAVKALPRPLRPEEDELAQQLALMVEGMHRLMAQQKVDAGLEAQGRAAPGSAAAAARANEDVVLPIDSHPVYGVHN